MNKQLSLLMTVFFTLLFSIFANAAPTAITPVEPTETSSESVFTTADPTNGNSIKNTAGDVIFLFRNSDAASAATVTVNVQDASVTLPGAGTVTKSNITCALDAGEECIVGPLPPLFWNDGNSNVQVTVSGDASGSVEIVGIKP